MIGLVVVGGLMVPVGVVSLQHRLQAQPEDFPRVWDDPQISRKLSEARFIKAKAIRQEWRTWALEHKTGLRAMLASQGKDLSKLEAIHRSIPPLRLKDWVPNTRSGPAPFNWRLDPAKVLNYGLKMSEKDMADLKSLVASGGNKDIQAEYLEKSDFVIATSENAGPTTTQIWVSGRITERSWQHNPDVRQGQSTSRQTPFKELMPPYDFLISATAG